MFVHRSRVAEGYLKQKELIVEAFTDDGWLRTGEIGEWNKDGTLDVIDRIKNLVKLSNGECTLHYRSLNRCTRRL
ncbi:long-chain fatty acid-CoA ligase [Mucor circinelloides]